MRKYFKVRPKDVYRPISEVLKEIETVTPPVTHPTVVTHPVTSEKILYVSEGFTITLKGMTNEEEASHVLNELFTLSGQSDKSYTHSNINLLEIEEGDLILWDNRRLVHHAKHSTITEPSRTHRLTVYDEFPFSS